MVVDAVGLMLGKHAFNDDGVPPGGYRHPRKGFALGNSDFLGLYARLAQIDEAVKRPRPPPRFDEQCGAIPIVALDMREGPLATQGYPKQACFGVYIEIVRGFVDAHAAS